MAQANVHRIPGVGVLVLRGPQQVAKGLWRISPDPLRAAASNSARRPLRFCSQTHTGTSGVTQTRGSAGAAWVLPAPPGTGRTNPAVCLSPDTHCPGWGPSSPARGAARTPTPSSPRPPSPRPVSLYPVSLGRHRARPQGARATGPLWPGATGRSTAPGCTVRPPGHFSQLRWAEISGMQTVVWGCPLAFSVSTPNPRGSALPTESRCPRGSQDPPPYRGTSGTPEPGQGPTLAWRDMRVHTHIHVCSQKGTTTASWLPGAGGQSLPTLQRWPPLTQGPRGGPWGRRYEARVLPPRIPAICTQTLAC